MQHAKPYGDWTRRNALIALLCCAPLVLLAFGRSLWQDFSPIDDGYLILQNLAIRGPSWEHLKTIFSTYDPELYIPFTLFSFQLDYLLAGLNPAMFHATNLLLHTLNAVLVGWLTMKLTGRNGFALFAALLFAVHPLHTEAVVWAAGRKDLLSTLFFLLATIFYLRYRSNQKRETTNYQPHHKALLLSIAFFLAALLSKAMAMTLPAVLLLLDLLIERRTINAKFFLDKIAYVAFSALCFVVAIGGKERILASSTLWETLLMACKSTVFYATKFFFPFGLTVYYPHNGPISLASPNFFVPVVILVIVAIIAILAWRRWPRLCFGLLFFALTLSPTFFNFHKGELLFFAVDRYAYLPSFGLLLIVSLFASWLLEKDLHLRLLQAIGAALLVCAVALSMKQTSTWDGPEQLFGRALQLYPNSLPARLDLADTLLGQGRAQESFALLKEGLKQGEHAQLFMAAGNTYARVGQVSEARAQFLKAKDLAPANPEPLFALGSLDEQAGKLDDALQLYTRAYALDESYVAAMLGIARINLARNKPAEAEAVLSSALIWNPNSVEGHVLAARLAMLQQREDDAMRHIGLALQLDPTNAEAQAFRLR